MQCQWSVPGACVVLTLLAANVAIASPENVHAKMAHLQGVVTPLQTGAENIIQIYSDFESVSYGAPGANAGLPDALIGRVRSESALFFSRIHKLYSELPELIAPEKLVSCQSEMESSVGQLIEDLERRVANSDEVRNGLKNGFSSEFYVIAHQMGVVLFDSVCF